MIAKGVPHAHGARLARYLITGKDRERAQLLELRGFAAAGIVEAFRSVHVMASGSKCVFPFFHVSVRNADGETLDADQWTYTADAIELSLGLANQPRAIAFHTCEETGESHMHVAWSRIDDESLLAKPLPFFKERLKRVSRQLEKHFGLTEVSSWRKGPITYAPTRREEEQSRRLGTDLRDHRETIRGCFDRSDCGRSFQKALAAEEIILARGDRRDFVAIDRAGGMHALGKRILGISAAEIRARLSDLVRDDLPTIEEGRQSLRYHPARNADFELHPIQPRRVNPEVGHGTELATSSANSPGPQSEGRGCEQVSPTAPEPLPGRAIPQTVDASTGGTHVAANKDHSKGLITALKRQFRAVANSVFKRMSSPQPHARRRKSGEAVGTFRLAARRLLKPIARLPLVAPAVGFLNDLLPWLHLWEWNEIAHHDATLGTVTSDDSHHSPHP
jgi:hypothetical protein